MLIQIQRHNKTKHYEHRGTYLSDNHELAVFIRDHQKLSTKPLIAVGMGAHGQLSRELSPISMVTHPLLLTATAPGQDVGCPYKRGFASHWSNS
jgi:hypothetical protein